MPDRDIVPSGDYVYQTGTLPLLDTIYARQGHANSKAYVCQTGTLSIVETIYTRRGHCQ